MDLPLAQLEVDAVDRGDRPEPLDDAAHRDGRHEGADRLDLRPAGYGHAASVDTRLPEPGRPHGGMQGYIRSQFDHGRAMSALLIRGGTVLDPAGPVRDADIRVEGALITEVAPNLAPRGGERVVDATDHIVMPGLISAHTHSGQNLDRGMAPNMPLDLWLIWVVYGGIRYTPDDTYVLALAGAAEMLRTGCTATLDHPWIPPDDFAGHAEALMQAYADSGIRAGVSPMLQDRDIFESMSFEGLDAPRPQPFGEALDPARLAADMRWMLDRWSGVHPRLTPIVGVSAPQRCSDELMTELAALANERGTQFHTHVLETRAQVFATRQRYGRSVVSFLDDLGLMTPRTSLAHCVWMDSGEFAAMRDTGAVVVHNPISNLRCGSGLLPLGDLLRGGVNVAIGVDGAASNDNQNVFEALKFASLIHTLYGDHRQWPTPEQVWAGSLHAGATALGSAIGEIRPGAVADLVLLDMERHVVADRPSVVASLVYAEHGESVRTVVVGGDVAVEDRRLTGVDGADLTRRSLALQRRIHDARCPFRGLCRIRGDAVPDART